MDAPASQSVLLRPNPGVQTLALQCPIDEILYGGARGGGKGVWLCLDWIQHWQECRAVGVSPAGLLIRKYLTDLRDWAREMAPRLKAVGFKYHKSEKTFEHEDGSTLTLAYLENETDAEHYQGWNLSWLAIDEVGQYAEPWAIDRLRATLRQPGAPRKRLRLTANPGGAGHDWLVERYISRAAPGVPFTRQVDLLDGTFMVVAAVFIPARLKDNPAADTPQYRAALAQAGPAWLVKAWLEGDWTVKASGGVFDVDELNYADRHPPLHNCRLYMGIDGAFTSKVTNDQCAIVVWATDEARRPWIIEAVAEHWDIPTLCDRIWAMWAKYEAHGGILSTWMEGGPSGKATEPWIKNQMQERGEWHHFELVSHMKDKVAKAGPFSAAVNSGAVWVCRDAPGLPKLRDQLLVFTGEDGIRDDLVDAGGVVMRKIRSLQTGQGDPPPPQPTVPRSSVEHRQDVKRAKAMRERMRSKEGPQRRLRRRK